MTTMTRIAATIAGAVLATIAGPAATAAAPTAHARPLEPCPTDEATGHACVWDAQHMGNGTGHSFLVPPGTPQHPDGRIIRLTHREAHRLIIWKD